MSELTALTIAAARDGLKQKKFSAVEIADAHLAAIVEFSDDAIISKDLNGVVTSWNKGAEKMFGYRAEEIIGRSISVLIPPQLTGEEAKFLKNIKKDRSVEHYETVRARKDGTYVAISLTVSPIKNEAGEIVGASKIARDISEPKRAQARQDLLVREIQHRTKNLFAVVRAVVGRSFAGKQTVEEAEAMMSSMSRALRLISLTPLLASDVTRSTHSASLKRAFSAAA